MAKRRSAKKLSPAQRVTSLVCMVILMIAAAIIWVDRNGNPFVSVGGSGSGLSGESQLTIHVIDVGNADSILITCGGRSLLIDAGENDDGETVVSYLKSHHVEKLDTVIATHPDADHIGGMDDVVNAFKINTFIMSIMPEKLTPTTKNYERLLAALDQQGVAITRAEVGYHFTLGEATAAILGPVGEFDSTNNMSVVCRITLGSRSFLFMGDAEKEAEDALLKAGDDLSADFIKIGHHGSKSSSQKSFLKVVRPQYAAISCGKGNDYGHPHAKTLETLEDLGITYLRTDLSGTIKVISDGQTITMEPEKDSK